MERSTELLLVGLGSFVVGVVVRKVFDATRPAGQAKAPPWARQKEMLVAAAPTRPPLSVPAYRDDPAGWLVRHRLTCEQWLAMTLKQRSFLAASDTSTRLDLIDAHCNCVVYGYGCPVDRPMWG